MRVKYVFMDFPEGLLPISSAQEFSPFKASDGFSFLEIDFSKIVLQIVFFLLAMAYFEFHLDTSAKLNKAIEKNFVILTQNCHLKIIKLQCCNAKGTNTNAFWGK